jgi:hypothetical protein
MKYFRGIIDPEKSNLPSSSREELCGLEWILAERMASAAD